MFQLTSGEVGDLSPLSRPRLGACHPRELSLSDTSRRLLKRWQVSALQKVTSTRVLPHYRISPQQMLS